MDAGTAGSRAAARAPSLLDDLGVVAAVSRNAHPWTWAMVGAGIATTVLWARADVWVPCVVVILSVAIGVPLLPRSLLRGWGAASSIVAAGAALAVWRGTTSGGSEPAAFLAVLGIGIAASIPWAAATAHAMRRAVDARDAEAASARAAIWAAEHRWRVIAACALLAGPLGVLWVDAADAGYNSSHFLRGLLVPEWFSPGATLVIAAVSGRRTLAATLEPAAVGFLGAAALTVAAAGLAGRTTGDELTSFVLVRGGLECAFVAAAVIVWRKAGPGPVTSRQLILTASAALTLHAVVAAAMPEAVWATPPRDWIPWAGVVLRDGAVLGVHLALAGSALSGPAIVRIAVVFGVLTALVDVVCRNAHDVHVTAAGIATIGALNAAVWTLAARRIRSFSVIPAGHRLRDDWAVDLGGPARPSGGRA